MNRRSYLAALAALAAGAALVLVAYGRPWVTAVVDDPGLPPIGVELTGAEWFPAAAAAGVVALAGLAAVVATRRVGRVVTGLVLVATGALAAWPAVVVARGDVPGVDAAVAQRVGSAVPVSVATTSWWAGALAGAVLVVGAGVACVWRGGRWPSMGRRYERPAAGAMTPAAAGHRGAADGPAPTAASTPDPGPRAALSPADAWAALDRGEDPTA